MSLKMEFKVYQGDARQVSKELKDQGIVIHAVVTSPPYFSKRKYGNSDLEIGQRSIEEYIKELTDVFCDIPLHPQGGLWVNLGDKRNGRLHMIPEKFAMSLIDRGWYLIDNVVWTKVLDNDDGTTEGGCMTEPAKRRLNSNGWEYLYHFSRDKKGGWSDVQSVSIPRRGIKDIRYLPPELMQTHTSVEGRNLHNSWRVDMGQTRKKHYAVFPLSLVERPIAMSCPMRVCGDRLISRIVKMEEYDEGRGSKRIFGKYTSIEDTADVKKSGRMDSNRQYVAKRPVTQGWGCDGEIMPSDDLSGCQPGTVLDPFCGSGTTGEAALKLGRSFIGIDLYDDFSSMSYNRCRETLDYLESRRLDPWVLHN